MYMYINMYIYNFLPPFFLKMNDVTHSYAKNARCKIKMQDTILSQKWCVQAKILLLL